MEMDEMECVCGEILKGEKGKGELAKQYAEHQLRPDHQISPAQWTEAANRIARNKENAAKRTAGQ